MCSILGMQYKAIASELETELKHDEQQRQQDEQTCASWRGGGRLQRSRVSQGGERRKEQLARRREGDGGRRKSRSWIYRGEEIDRGGQQSICQQLHNTCRKRSTHSSSIHGHLLTEKVLWSIVQQLHKGGNAKDMEHKTLARILPKGTKG